MFGYLQCLTLDKSMAVGSNGQIPLLRKALRTREGVTACLMQLFHVVGNRARVILHLVDALPAVIHILRYLSLSGPKIPTSNGCSM